MAGDRCTGASVMRLGAGLDSGPLALQEETPIGPEDDFEVLAAKLAALGGELLVGALDLSAEGRLELEEQDEEGATYAEKIAPAERRLDPSRPAVELARVVRALTPHIGAYLEISGGGRLGVRRARPVDVSVKTGDVRAEWGALLLGCGAWGAAAGSRPARRAASRCRSTPTCAVTPYPGCERGVGGPGRRLRGGSGDV